MFTKRVWTDLLSFGRFVKIVRGPSEYSHIRTCIYLEIGLYLCVCLMDIHLSIYLPGRYASRLRDMHLFLSICMSVQLTPIGTHNFNKPADRFKSANPKSLWSRMTVTLPVSRL